MDGTKIWTDLDLESSTLFEAPKEKNLNETNNSSSTENKPPIPFERNNNNNNNNDGDVNTIIEEHNDTAINRSHELFPSNEKNTCATSS